MLYIVNINEVKTIIMSMIKYDYNYIDDMDFSGFFEFTLTHEFVDKYFIFIKFANKMYIHIKNIGSIIMPYVQFINNEYLKKYYELTLLLMKNKNCIIKKTHHTGDIDWFLDCAYILNDNDLETNIKRVEKGTYYCYSNINPYDLKGMGVSTDEDIEIFFNKLLDIDTDYDENIKQLVVDYAENKQNDSDSD
jgi:hypothetical protein